jgi:hypothetical protein
MYLRYTWDLPCADLRRHRHHGSSTATTPTHPMLLVMEMIARLQVGHLPNPIFERDKSTPASTESENKHALVA